MADYYPLIARAIAGLDPSAPGESRRALYERARSALIAQLRRGLSPRFVAPSRRIQVVVLDGTACLRRFLMAQPVH